MEWKVGEKICSQISHLLIKRTPFESEYRKVLSVRDNNIKKMCIQYTHNAMNTVRDTARVNVDDHNLSIQNDHQELPKGRRMGQRLSIVKKKKTTTPVLKNKTKKKNSFLKEQLKDIGLIKLNLEENQDPDYSKLIEVMRKRKEKYNWVIEQFEKKEEQIKNIKNKSSQKYITNFEGKILKIERRYQKDNHFFDKLKVKPMFKLKSSRYEKKNTSESAKSNHENIDFLKIDEKEVLKLSQRSFRSDKTNFKSILNIIQTKKYLDPMRKTRRKK